MKSFTLFLWNQRGKYLRPFHGKIWIAMSGMLVKEFSIKRQAIFSELHVRAARSIATAPPDLPK